MPRLPALAVLVLAAAMLGLPVAAEVRLLAFGDSLVSGFGLPERQGFVPQLQAWLRAHGAGDVTVVNAGVPGETTAEARRRIGTVLSPDIDGVIVVLGGNDILRGVPVPVIGRNLNAILGAIDRPVLLAGLPAPPLWGRKDREALRGMFRGVAEAHGARFRRSFLAGLGQGRTPRQIMALIQPDGLHPNAAGVAAIVADIGPAVLHLAADARRGAARRGSAR